MRAILGRCHLIAMLTLCWPVTSLAQQSVKISEPTRYFGELPIYAAIDGGFGKKEGIDIEIVTMKGGPAAANALLSGDVDAYSGSIENALKLIEKGKDVKVIAGVQQRSPCAILVPADSPAKTLADLKGQSIAVTATGSSTDLQLRGLIISEKMNPATDFKIVGLGSAPTVTAALEHGQVGAAVVTAPFLMTSVNNKKSKILIDLRHKAYLTLALIVRNSDLTGPRAGVFRALVRAVSAAQDKLNTDYEFAARVARAYFPNLDPAVIDEMIKVEIQRYHTFPTDGSVSEEAFNNAVDTLKVLGEMKKPISYGDVIVR